MVLPSPVVVMVMNVVVLLLLPVNASVIALCWNGMEHLLTGPNKQGLFKKRSQHMPS